MNSNTADQGRKYIGRVDGDGNVEKIMSLFSNMVSLRFFWDICEELSSRQFVLCYEALERVKRYKCANYLPKSVHLQPRSGYK